MTREDVRQIIESGSETDDVISQLLNRFQAEKSQIKADPENQRKAESLEKELFDANSKIKDMRKQLSEARSEIKTSQQDLQDSQDLLEQIRVRDEQIQSLQGEIRDNKISSAVGLVLAHSGVKNQKFADLITKSIDMGQVEIDKDGNVTGIEEQVNALKEDEETSMLFKTSPDKSFRQTYSPLVGAERKESPFVELFEAERQQKQENANATEDPFLKALK